MLPMVYLLHVMQDPCQLWAMQ